MAQCFRGGGATLKTKLKKLLTLWGKNHIAGNHVNGELDSHICQCERLQGAQQSKIKFLDCFTRKGFAMTKGFTLAEVLITLTILGVIAALVVPNVVQSYNQKVTVAKVRKFYSNLYSVYSFVMNTNSKSRNLSIYTNDSAGAKKILDDFIKPNYKIAYDAGTNTTNKQKIMASENVKYLNGQTMGGNYSTDNKYYAVKLQDGSTLWFRGYNDSQKNMGFFVDINGKKGPNTLGKDIFSVGLEQDKEIDYISESYQKLCIKEDSPGWSCIGWIVVKGNMNYLKCPGKVDYASGNCQK